MLLSKVNPAPKSSAVNQAGEHPFLIVSKNQYAALQARAARWPWSEQKESALYEVEKLRYFPDSRIDIRSINLAKIFSTTALAYVLDPENRPKYVARIVEHLKAFDVSVPGNITSEMQANPSKNLWIFGVPTGNAFFQGVLALDIIHDDLPPDQLAAIEGVLRDGPAKYFRDTPLAWRQGAYAAAAIWPLYERDRAAYQPIVDDWVRSTLTSISADGVFVGGAGYADARWSFADREHKALFGDVLVHTGVLPNWYAEPKVAKLQEWLNGYAYTPFHVLWTVGDSGPERFNGTYQPGSERASRYSPLAGRYAAWLRNGVMPPAALASYILADETPAEPAAAPSRIFTDGGAWLKETSLDWRSISGALWNLADAKDAHAHKETNSVCVAAYGEMLLRAGGYNGWATAEQGFSWEYIHDRAIAGNIVLFDYAVPSTLEAERLPPAENDHVRRHGIGITQSLLTGVIDFAHGDSGDAIPNGRHGRDFLFVHPADGANGYYVVFDHLTASPNATAQIVWHPSSARCTTTADRQEYTWPIKEFGDRDVGLTLFLATPPTAVDLRDGVLANWGHGVVAKYLVGHYPIDGSSRRTVATILFPHDDDHPKAHFEYFGVEHARGTVVRQSGCADYIFESDGVTSFAELPDVHVCADAGYLRRTGDGRLATAWLKNATVFQTDTLKLESAMPLTVCQFGDAIRVVARESTHASLTLAKAFELKALDGQTLKSDAAGFLQFDIAAGTHSFRIRPL